jgi:hypothetical protein
MEVIVMKRLMRVLLIAALAVPMFQLGCLQKTDVNGGWDVLRPNPGALICARIPAQIRNLIMICR